MNRFFPFLILFFFQIRGTEQINLVIRNNFGSGFFCEFNKVIAALHLYSDDRLASVSVDWSDQFFPYKDEPMENGWSLYFDEIRAKRDCTLREVVVKHPFGVIHNFSCLAQWLQYADYMPYRLSMHAKIREHIRINHAILEKVDKCCEQYFDDNIMIGLHIRHAKVHAKEIPSGKRPTMQQYKREIDAILAEHACENIKIFLASDSHAVMNYFRKIYGNQLVAIEAFRARRDEDPHLVYEKGDYYKKHVCQWHKDKPGYWGGSTALMDCLLLARCDYFIHTASNLAQTVTFLNPYIKSIFLPKVVFSPCRCVPFGGISPNPDFMPK